MRKWSARMAVRTFAAYVLGMGYRQYVHTEAEITLTPDFSAGSGDAEADADADAPHALGRLRPSGWGTAPHRTAHLPPMEIKAAHVDREVSEPGVLSACRCAICVHCGRHSS